MFKIVKEVGGEYFSSNVVGRYQVQYYMHNWTVPKVEGTKLFVFEELDVAVEFMYTEGLIVREGGEWQCKDHKLFLVVARNPEIMTDAAHVLETEILDEFWQGVRSSEFSSGASPGTYGADAVMLVRSVDWHNTFSLLMGDGLLHR